MKKVLSILVIMMSVLTVNAQSAKTSTTKTKPEKMTVKVADLQKSITDNIAKDYPGFTIKEATCIKANNTTTYDVVVTKGSTSETLVYDNNGAFVKKLSQPTAMHHTSKKK